MNSLSVGDQPQRFPRNTQTDLEFRTYRHPLHESAEMAGQEFVLLVTAVKTDFLPEQAGGNADANAGDFRVRQCAPPKMDPRRALRYLKISSRSGATSSFRTSVPPSTAYWT